MTAHKPTCGPLYIKARDVALSLCGGYPILIFWSGFVIGQAEEIASGACQAGKFKPEAQYFDELRKIVRAVVPVYGLQWGAWEDELWIFHLAAYEELRDTLKLPKNSPEWRRRRTQLLRLRTAAIDELPR